MKKHLTLLDHREGNTIQEDVAEFKRKLESLSSHMYRENRKSLNWFVGCGHGCIYCKPSFQRQMKRQRQNCLKCYRYEPHAHLERLLKPPPKTSGDEFIFFPSSGDPAFASLRQLGIAIDYTSLYPNTTFLMQTKDPTCFLLKRKFPDNLILGITLETNKICYLETPSHYKKYSQISEAPSPYIRWKVFYNVQHKRKMVTIEPILDFNPLRLPEIIQLINPEIVYVGYDNHSCKLPEPTLAKTQLLIKELRKFTQVRVKTLRKAWWEK